MESILEVVGHDAIECEADGAVEQSKHLHERSEMVVYNDTEFLPVYGSTKI